MNYLFLLFFVNKNSIIYIFNKTHKLNIYYNILYKLIKLLLHNFFQCRIFFYNYSR